LGFRRPERPRCFEEEDPTAAKLNHPNIVSIFHAGQYDGSPYIVTELLHGETLHERALFGAGNSAAALLSPNITRQQRPSVEPQPA